MNIKFPLQFDHRGRTAESKNDDHIREMIEQVFAGEENVQLIDRNLSNFIPLLNLNQTPQTGVQQ